MAGDASPPPPVAVPVVRRARSPLLPPRPTTVRAPLPPPRRDRSRSPQRWRPPPPGADYEDDYRARGPRGGRNGGGRSGRGRGPGGGPGGPGGPVRMRSRSPPRLGRDRSRSPPPMGRYRERSRSLPGRSRDGGPPRPRDAWEGPSNGRDPSRDRDGSGWRRSMSPPLRLRPRSPSPTRRSPPPFRQQGPFSDRPSLLSRLAGGGPREFDYEDGEVSPERGPRSRMGHMGLKDRIDRRRGSPERPRTLKDRIMLPDEGYDSGPAVLDYDEVPETTTPPLPPSPPAVPAPTTVLSKPTVREASAPLKTDTPPFEPPPSPPAPDPAVAAATQETVPPPRRSRFSQRLPTPPPPSRTATAPSNVFEPAGSPPLAFVKDREPGRGRSRTRSPARSTGPTEGSRPKTDDRRPSPPGSTEAGRALENGPSTGPVGNASRRRSPSTDRGAPRPQRRRVRSPSPSVPSHGGWGSDTPVNGSGRPPLPARRPSSRSPPPSRRVRRRSSTSRSRSRSRGASSPDKEARSRRSTSSRRRSMSRSRSPSVPPPRGDVDTSRYPRRSRSPPPPPRSPRRAAVPLASQSGAFGTSFAPPPGPGSFRGGRGGFDAGFRGRGAPRGRGGWGAVGPGRGGPLGMVANGGPPSQHLSPPAGPSSLLPIAPGFTPVGVPLGPRTKDNRSWAERTAARAAEQAEAEVERERRAVREADQQEMLRRKEEDERKNQPLGGKEWNDRIKAIEDRKQERARLAMGGDPGTRSAEGTPDVEMKSEPSPVPSPARQVETAASPLVEAVVSGGASAFHPSRRSYVQTQSHAISMEHSPSSLSGANESAYPSHASVLPRPTRPRSPTPPTRQPPFQQPAPVAPIAVSSLPSRPTPSTNHDRSSFPSASDRTPSFASSQQRERSPPPPELSREERMQRDRERVERERMDDYIGRLLKAMPPVDLNKMWGGSGKTMSDAELKRLQKASTDLQGNRTRLYVDVWRAEQDLKNLELELEGVEVRKKIAEAGIRR